jgi:hypothetical protein
MTIIWALELFAATKSTNHDFYKSSVDVIHPAFKYVN